MRKILTMSLGIFLLGLITPSLAVAQTGKFEVKGVVVDASGAPIIGASVFEVGATNGTITDANGEYSLTVKDGNSTISVSFIGYKEVQLLANSTLLARVVLDEDLAAIDEVVVIGYGAVKKDDMTGSVIAVKAENLNRGAVTSPQEMLRGKVPGVNITSGNGAPGAGSEIRIRGGASLSANNNPLIVIDGVPIAEGAGVGIGNGLSMVNPDDIASFTVLKDASATAIYGSRASNGVIIITTKKGSGEIKASYTGSVSVRHNHKTLDLMNAAELKEYVTGIVGDKASALFGQADTDWQKEIFRLGISTDHNISVYGGAFKNKLPFRVSAAYNYDQGTLKTSDNQRATLGVNLSPKFFDEHLSVQLNAKGIFNKANYADTGAIGAAVGFDPTQSPYIYGADGKVDTSVNNGYWNWSTDLAGINPFSTLYDKWDKNEAYRAMGNLQLDYKVHGLEELSFNLNLGLDVTIQTLSWQIVMATATTRLVAVSRIMRILTATSSSSSMRIM